MSPYARTMSMEPMMKEVYPPKKKRGRNKVHKVMGEFKRGTLRSSSGEKVTNRDQAVAIAMSESGLSWKK